MSEFKLNLNKREVSGKNKVDKLRAEGLIPGVIYSKGKEAVCVKGLEKDLLKLYSEAGTSNIITVTLDGETKNVLFKDVQMHHIKNAMVHYDLYEVDMNQALRVMIPVVLEGKDNVKVQPSNLIQVVDEIEIECLPKDLPAEAMVNVVDMQIGDTMTVADLDVAKNDKITILVDMEEVIATLAEPRDEAELEALDADVEEAGEVPTVSETNAKEDAE